MIKGANQDPQQEQTTSMVRKGDELQKIQTFNSRQETFANKSFDISSNGNQSFKRYGSTKKSCGGGIRAVPLENNNQEIASRISSASLSSKKDNLYGKNIAQLIKQEEDKRNDYQIKANMQPPGAYSHKRTKTYN
eukprot:CAMPEP_0170552742 /NCGR_PEP_ID=MMETSP0211-20121228/10635_1 /TAXON_ID=311385 /ORGANISM="Pseudokeronopsis sp., Strain OXSARD2" /LENGTH=134 /DNA_ID=CAMNT_0010860693 /DNA_START=1966 /DNA_END=2370 /DNA_ORIENTATION=-